MEVRDFSLIVCTMRKNITQITMEDYIRLYWGRNILTHAKCWYCGKGHPDLRDLQLFCFITYGDLNDVTVTPITIYMKFCDEACLNCWILE